MTKRQWRIGWRPLGQLSAKPTYDDGPYFDCFADAEKFRKEIAKDYAFHDLHTFCDVVPDGSENTPTEFPRTK